MTDRTLVYVLNAYHPGEASHFAHVARLLDEIAAQGVRVVLVIEKHSGVAPPLQSPGIQVVLQQKRRGLARLAELYRLLVHHGRGADRAVFVRISARAACVALAARLRTGCPVFYWQSGTTHDQDRQRSWSLATLRWLLTSRLPFGIVLRCADRFVTGPQRMVAYYRDRFDLPAERVACLANDVDLERFRPADPARRAAVRAELGWAPDAMVWLFVHRLSPVRRTLYYLPHVFADYLERRGEAARSDRFVVVGDGPERGALERALAEAGLADRVDLVGAMPNDGLMDHYAAADAFVNPTWAEGFPRVLLEAMASGLPIVTTDAGGIPDLLGSAQQRFVVPVVDREGMAGRMLEMAASASLRERLRAENLREVRRYATPAVARDYVSTLFGAAGTTPQPAVREAASAAASEGLEEAACMR